MSTVLVTGGSGFLGGHIMLQLLAQGHDVRATVRTPQRADVARAILQRGGAERIDRVSFVTAELEHDAGWAEAVAGCEYVLHVASPFPARKPKHDDELIVPAREGVLRVLRAARDAGVARVVLTSSFAAVGYGHASSAGPFDEHWWTNLDAPSLTAYVKSKTVAERAAWDFIQREGKGLQLTAINPVGIFGPLLGPDYATSILMVKQLLDGIPGCLRLYFGIVDVRDVADLHVCAMTHPAANGERFLATTGDGLWMRDVAEVLRRRMGAAAQNVPRHQLPDWIVKLVALGNPALRQLVPQLGRVRNTTNAKARTLLGWTPRSPEDAIVATAETLLALGLVG